MTNDPVAETSPIRAMSKGASSPLPSLLSSVAWPLVTPSAAAS